MSPRRLLAGALAFITVFCMAVADAAQGQPKEVVRVRGSGDMAERVSSCAKEFMKSHPGANIVVSGGPRIDWNGLASGDTDVVMASHKISDQEREALQRQGVIPDEVLTGYGGIVVVVSPSNPVNEMTADQVRKVLTGTYENWDQVGGKSQRIAVITVDETRSGFPESVRQEFLKGPLHRNAEKRSNFHSVISAVCWESNAIGFVRLDDLQRLKPEEPEAKVKVVSVKADERSPAVKPAADTVDNGSYPLKVPHYVYLNRKNTKPVVREFVDFCAAGLKR